MPTQQLVEQVKLHRLYKEYGTPDYDKILFALSKVDRRDFLDDELVELAATDVGAMKSLHEARMNLAGKGVIKTVAGFYGYDILGKMDEVLGTTSIIQAQATDLAYCDIALPIGYDQTCSQPSMVAYMLYLLELKEGQNVLEIGSGCGYHAAVCLGAIGDSGILTTIEIIPELATKTRNNLKQHLGQNDLVRGRARTLAG